MKNKNLFIPGLLAISMIIGVLGSFSGGFDFQASVLSIFNRMGITDFIDAYPDISIDYATMRKVSDPSEDFPFYKYKASLAIRNYGDTLSNGNVVLYFGDGQNVAYVRNGLNGLSLLKGETFIFDDYEITMDKAANFGSFEFNLELKDQNEKDATNNWYIVEILEDPAKIENFSFNSDGNFSYKYDGEDDVYVCYSHSAELSTEDLKYTEIVSSGAIYGYYKSRAFIDDLTSDKFSCNKLSDKSENGFAMNFKNDSVSTLFLKSCVDNGVCNKFAVSNFINIPVQKHLTKADFVKVFVEASGIPLDTSGRNYFKDVSVDDSFFPYVQTLFNHGLISAPKDFRFRPNEKVLRKDVLEPVLHYFDVDLEVSAGAPHFIDVPQSFEAFYFAETFYSNGKAKAFGNHLYPDKQATDQFVKYLINEFN